MPLNTQIARDGRELQLRWGWWHVSVMMDVATREEHGVRLDTDPALFHTTPLATRGRQVLTKSYKYRDESDGEILCLEPGDELRMWR